jgi:hypothetical protein
MDVFLVKLQQIINKVLVWSENFVIGERDYNFDIDNELYDLSEEYHVNFKQGDLLLIYNLLDFYCDAVKHGFKQIDKNYSVAEAQSDIKKVVNELTKANNCSFVVLSQDLKNRLEDI